MGWACGNQWFGLGPAAGKTACHARGARGRGAALADFRRGLIRGCFYDFHTLPPERDRLLVTLGWAYGMGELHQRLYREEAGKLNDVSST
jgi:hypothetical protein